MHTVQSPFPDYSHTILISEETLSFGRRQWLWGNEAQGENISASIPSNLWSVS